jgi:predicted GNAT family acetyltransferase
MELTVRRDEGRARYELVEAGSVIGFADYVVEGDTVVFPHTVIDPQRRGQGLGAVLVKGALDDVRPSGRAVIPTCWYVRDFIEAHADYADLLDGATRPPRP